MMGEVQLRFSVVGQKIFKQLDDKCLVKCKKISKAWCAFLDNTNVLINLPSTEAVPVFDIFLTGQLQM